MTRPPRNSFSPATDLTSMHRSHRQVLNKNKVVNPPIYRASTFLFDQYEDMNARVNRDNGDRYPYGLYGTDTVRQLEDMVANLEGTDAAVASGSGMSACAIPFLTFVAAGDHVLITDSVYGPVRSLAKNQLTRLGVNVEYFDPLATPDDLEILVRANTRMIYLESPGSVTFEIQDVKGIAALARSKGILTAIDNTWATPLHYQPAQYGVDLVIHAATKYIAGASDLLMGVVAGPRNLVAKMAQAQGEYGFYANPTDAFDCIKGLRSLAVRMPTHLASSQIVAAHLKQQQEIAAILHPALDTDLMNQRYIAQGFNGGGGLFGAIFDPTISEQFVARFANALRLFGMGYSWGGFESLISAQQPKKIRTASHWPRAGLPDGVFLRFNIGLEAPKDLCRDIDQALDIARKS